MRLLHASTYVFEEFFHGYIPPYAILSHTWGDGEVLYQDVVTLSKGARQQLQDGKAGISKPIQERGWAKIRNCCAEALQRDLRWVWIDTCCIDKSSSTDLSEAINSMYSYYQQADICLAYLSDVLPSTQSESLEASLRRSRWFTRGWTLQELLAPKTVLFYGLCLGTADWMEIGTRQSLKQAISRVTRIDAQYLDGQDISGASVAQRMSWASERKTMRQEDIAYCLLGIFDVNMPLLYGEGLKAFRRLQQEIMKTNDDQSLLAWGLHPHGASAEALATFRAASGGDPLQIPKDSRDRYIGDVLASNPAFFRNSASIRPYAVTEVEPYDMSLYGLRIQSSLVHFGQFVLSHEAEAKIPIQYAFIRCFDQTPSNRIAIPVIGSNTFERCMPALTHPVAPESLWNVPLGYVSSGAPRDILLSRQGTTSHWLRPPMPRFAEIPVPRARCLLSGLGDMVINDVSPWDQWEGSTQMVFGSSPTRLEFGIMFSPISKRYLQQFVPIKFVLTRGDAQTQRRGNAKPMPSFEVGYYVSESLQRNNYRHCAEALDSAFLVEGTGSFERLSSLELAGACHKVSFSIPLVSNKDTRRWESLAFKQGFRYSFTLTEAWSPKPRYSNLGTVVRPLATHLSGRLVD